MDARRKDGSYVQCQKCGHIYQIAHKVSIEKSIIKTVCPTCGGCVGLNCGDKKEDIYIFMNPNVDERYYTY